MFCYLNLIRWDFKLEHGVNRRASNNCQLPEKVIVHGIIKGKSFWAFLIKSFLLNVTYGSNKTFITTGNKVEDEQLDLLK